MFSATRGVGVLRSGVPVAPLTAQYWRAKGRAATPRAARAPALRAAKADPPGTMRCGMCGQKFTDLKKLEKHFATLHERERAARYKHGRRAPHPRPGQKPLDAAGRAREERYQHARATLGEVETDESEDAWPDTMGTNDFFGRHPDAVWFWLNSD